MAGFKNLRNALRAPFAKRFGLGDPAGDDFAQSADFIPRWRDEANSAEFEFAPSVQVLNWFGSLADQTIFLANYKTRILSIRETHSVAGSDAGAVSLQVKKETGTQAPATGVPLLASVFDLKSTANIPVLGTLTTNGTALTLDPGERLSLDFVGTLTDLAGVCVTIEFIDESRTRTVMFNAAANAAVVDTVFHVHNRPTTVKKISMLHSVVGSDGGAVTAHIEKNDGTDAPGSGTTIQSGTFNLKGTVNTVQNATLTSTAADLAFVAGDRFACDITGTATAVAGLIIAVSYEEREPALQDCSYYLVANASLADATFFVSPGEYEVIDSRATWSTAFAGGANLQVTQDVGAVAPGAGTNLLTQDSAAGFQIDGTANTPEVGSLTATRSLKLLGPSDRLAVDYSATTTGVGPCVTVTLKRLGKKIGT
jgi:hypothetical protein